MHNSWADAAESEEQVAHQRRFAGINMTDDDKINETLSAAFAVVYLRVLLQSVHFFLPHLNDRTRTTWGRDRSWRDKKRISARGAVPRGWQLARRAWGSWTNLEPFLVRLSGQVESCGDRFALWNIFAKPILDTPKRIRSLNKVRVPPGRARWLNNTAEFTLSKSAWVRWA